MFLLILYFEGFKLEFIRRKLFIFILKLFWNIIYFLIENLDVFIIGLNFFILAIWVEIDY